MTNKNPVREHIRRGRLEGSFFTLMKQVPRAWGVMILGCLFTIANPVPSLAGTFYVTGGGDGNGTVGGSIPNGGGISCTISGGNADPATTCSLSRPTQPTMSVTATPNADSTFAGWSYSDGSEATRDCDADPTILWVKHVQ